MLKIKFIHIIITLLLTTSLFAAPASAKPKISVNGKKLTGKRFKFKKLSTNIVHKKKITKKKSCPTIEQVKTLEQDLNFRAAIICDDITGQVTMFIQNFDPVSSIVSDFETMDIKIGSESNAREATLGRSSYVSGDTQVVKAQLAEDQVLYSADITSYLRGRSRHYITPVFLTETPFGRFVQSVTDLFIVEYE